VTLQPRTHIPPANQHLPTHLPTSFTPTPTTLPRLKSSGRYECADAPSSSTAPPSGMNL
jgi:hypothetical protein